jgi:threonine/homoserine/homoserine lactone efflux protein
MTDGTDPTRVRDQPAIRSGRRRSWLVPAGLLAGITIALLVAALGLEMRIAAVGIVATAALYAAMLVVAVAVRPVRRRNVALAWLMILIAVVALGSLLLLLGAARAGA